MTDPLYPRHANSGPAPEVTPVSGFDMLRAWFIDSGAAEYWASVKCIECEIGRTCLQGCPDVCATCGYGNGWCEC